jgi:hypothetical protein
MRGATMPKQLGDKAPANSSRAADRYASIGFRVTGGNEVSWANMPTEVVRDVVAYTTAAGDAVLFGNTRQGGLSLTLYSDGQPIKVYSNSMEDMIHKCNEVCASARLVIPNEVLVKLEGLHP